VDRLDASPPGHDEERDALQESRAPEVGGGHGRQLTETRRLSLTNPRQVPTIEPMPLPWPRSSASGAGPAAQGFFLSEFLGEKVLDVARRPVGTIRDLVVDTGVRSPFPSSRGSSPRPLRDFVPPWEDVAIFQRGAVRSACRART